jgi:hypothetical protein
VSAPTSDESRNGIFAHHRWDVRHTIREVIANALDEQALTGTAELKIELLS